MYGSLRKLVPTGFALVFWNPVDTPILDDAIMTTFDTAHIHGSLGASFCEDR
jgi:hypothetical protein